ncbi:MAG: APC family permease, partial [Chitinophagales bacterium]|nr:APC family permease [Chitinophagales bacterium]
MSSVLKKEIGLLTGVAFVTGGVIGMGAFVLIPLICAKAGGSAWFSISVALMASILGVFPLIQLSAAYPVAGGGYTYGKIFFGNDIGMIFGLWAVIGGSAGVALVSFGLAQSFIEALHLDISAHLFSLGIVVLFWLIFHSGLKTLASLQNILVAQMLLSLLIYGIPMLLKGPFNVSWKCPTFNNDFFISILFSFNISMGFQIIIEFGEEMKNPSRNIPLALIIGGGIIWLIYILMSAAYISAVGEEQLQVHPELVSTANGVLPEWLQGFIRLGIISAGLTCFVGAGVAIPREILAMARDKVIPNSLAYISARGTPVHATNLFFILVCGFLLLGEVFAQTGVLAYFFERDEIEFYGFLSILGLMTLGGGVSLSSLFLKRKMPDAYAKAYIRFKPYALNILVVLSVTTSILLIVLISSKWIIPLIFFA